jgi:hypothetical protein
VKGEYDREESYGEDHSFWEGGSILRRGYISVGDFSMEISGVRILVLGGFGESEAGGTSFLGVLGMGARISLWYPRAREPDRLVLAGREENSVLGSV